jgi:hypothetical protein
MNRQTAQPSMPPFVRSTFALCFINEEDSSLAKKKKQSHPPPFHPDAHQAII